MSKLNTIAKWVNDTYNGEYTTIGRAAQAVGRSTRTLKRWKSDGKVDAPSHFVEVGEAKINLYSANDLDELRAYAGVVRPGRPRTVPCGV